jgi:benzoylformate decarboxylase
MYSPQALWSAARERVPVTFVVLDNSEYLILKQSMRSMYGRSMTDRPVGLHLDDPALRFCTLAASMGVIAHSVNSADELSDAVKAAVGTDVPTLVHVKVGDVGA